MATCTPIVSEQAKQIFDRDGVVKIPGALAPAWVELLVEAAEEILAETKRMHADAPAESVYKRNESGGFYFTENAWTFNDKLKRFAFDSVVAQAGAEILDSKEIRLFETVAIYKEEGCDQGTAWHQDLPQHGVTGRQAVSGWLSLEAVTLETGALRVVAGSHKGPWYTPPFMPPGREQFRVEFEGGPIPDIEADPKRFPIVSYDTEPGDLILVHPTALHSAYPSATRGRRRTFSLRLQGDDIRRKASPNEFAVWVQDLGIKDGDRMVADCFPQLWPPASAHEPAH